ncbi:hypothetical protein AX282_13425 [Bacillus spizizenii]|uniref:Repressor FruR n=1 Tax=Bacillus spizizenii (strain DSM 15029 / JCM 12233 / NBRC 101239 / NRRL B-23049 / TU-B-10) TaxID=1052585 RepID=G4NPY9_BACS4|nr:repressor FruR [Bacillus spizizenii]AEP86917.1 repressor FruR [Bacillus spizizenii TU-B-10]KXJ38855.1 hypothetical protein AX282_13425 [Bacillus spizizenii]GEK24133.1 hypothetical protein BSU04nite_05220 [Bacillus spizizenii]
MLYLIAVSSSSRPRIFKPTDQPIELISETAIEILEKQIEGEFDDLPLETYLPVQLFEGGTT